MCNESCKWNEEICIVLHTISDHGRRHVSVSFLRTGNRNNDRVELSRGWAEQGPGWAGLGWARHGVRGRDPPLAQQGQGRYAKSSSSSSGMET